MIKKSNNFHFSAISIKDVVASRFRVFSKRIAKTHTETLTLIMDFFEWHGFYPSDRYEKSVIKELLKNRKRTEASIAISKSIEKSQNIPLTNIETMLKSLFQEEVKKYAPKLIDTKCLDKSKSKISKEKKGVSQIEFDRTKDKLIETKDRLRYILEQIEPIKNRFGKDYLRINIPREQLARFKQALKNV